MFFHYETKFTIKKQKQNGSCWIFISTSVSIKYQNKPFKIKEREKLGIVQHLLFSM